MYNFDEILTNIATNATGSRLNIEETDSQIVELKLHIKELLIV